MPETARAWQDESAERDLPRPGLRRQESIDIQEVYSPLLSPASFLALAGITIWPRLCNFEVIAITTVTILRQSKVAQMTILCHSRHHVSTSKAPRGTRRLFRGFGAGNRAR